MIINKKKISETGSSLWEIDDNVEGAYLLHSGVYQLYDSKKDETITLTSGAFIIDITAIKSGTKHTTSMSCLGGGFYFLIDKEEMLAFVRQNPGLLMKFSEEKYVL